MKSFEQQNLVIFVLKVGKPGFSSLANRPKHFKSWIHSFPAWRSAQ